MIRVAPLLLLACLGALAAGDKSLEGYKVYRLSPVTDEQVAWVRGMRRDPALDFWSVGDVMVAPARQPAFEAQLAQLALPWDVLVPDVQMTVDAERVRQARGAAERLLDEAEAGTRGISFARYNRYDEVVAYLGELAAARPDLVTVSSLGVSSEGRQIPLVKISSGGSGRRPAVLVDAGIHAREWIAPAMALYVVQQLVENPSNADLLAHVDWHVVPLLNPDGYEYTHTNYRLWRKTRSVTSRCLGSSDTRQGVDANRNFDFYWMLNGASSNPCSDTYAGSKAFSEPETAALRDYVRAHAATIRLYLTFHSYGNYLLYPWGYTSDLPDNWRDLDELARRANAAQVAAGGASYSVGSSTNVLYAAAGGSDDWVKGAGGVPLAYTVELPGGGVYGFDLPASAVARTVATFWSAVRVFGEHVSAQAR